MVEFSAFLLGRLTPWAYCKRIRPASTPRRGGQRVGNAHARERFSFLRRVLRVLTHQRLGGVVPRYGAELRAAIPISPEIYPAFRGGSHAMDLTVVAVASCAGWQTQHLLAPC